MHATKLKRSTTTKVQQQQNQKREKKRMKMEKHNAVDTKTVQPCSHYMSGVIIHNNLLLKIS